MSKYQRTKGANWERVCSIWWRSHGYPFARRKLSQYQASDGCDIENTEPFIAQCKSGKQINIMKAYKEAQGSSKKGQIPLAMVKYDREEPLVVLSLDDFDKVLNQRI